MKEGGELTRARPRSRPGRRLRGCARARIACGRARARAAPPKRDPKRHGGTDAASDELARAVAHAIEGACTAVSPDARRLRRRRRQRLQRNRRQHWRLRLH